MKNKTAILACLLALSLVPAMADAAPRQTLTASFGQRKVLLEAPKGMCFLDTSDAAQGSLITDMRLQSWKGRKNVVMAVFGLCNEISNMGKSKDPVSLSKVGVVRWLNPDIGPKSELALQDYLTIREVSYRSDVASDLTQFRHINLEKEVRRLDNAVAIGYLGKTEVESQPFKTVGVDATTLINNIPLDISISHTASSLDKIKEDTEPLYNLMQVFVDQQLFINNNK